MIPGQLNFQKGLRSNTDLLFPQKQKKEGLNVYTQRLNAQKKLFCHHLCLFFILLAYFTDNFWSRL